MLPRWFDRLATWAFALFLIYAFSLLAYRIMQIGQKLPEFDPWIQFGAACLAAHAVHRLGKKRIWTFLVCVLIAGIVVPNLAPTYSLIQAGLFAGTIIVWAWHFLRREIQAEEAHRTAIEKLGKY